MREKERVSEREGGGREGERGREREREREKKKKRGRLTRQDCLQWFLELRVDKNTWRYGITNWIVNINAGGAYFSFAKKAEALGTNKLLFKTCTTLSKKLLKLVYSCW